MSDPNIKICPYNKSHLVLKTRFQNHLVKCAKNHPHLYVCVYNATHRMPVSEMLDHLKVCESKKMLASGSIGSNVINQKPIYHDKEDALVFDEEWNY